jgi:hypothetical protein
MKADEAAAGLGLDSEAVLEAAYSSEASFETAGVLHAADEL